MGSSDPREAAGQPHRDPAEEPLASVHAERDRQQVPSVEPGPRAQPAGLTVVIPAYNERLRLPPYLDSIRQYLDGQELPGYEVIVVDDGSADGMAEPLARLAARWPPLRVIRHPHNRGKGAAVRTGMLAAGGQRLLFADADGATPIEEERKLRLAIDAGADVAVGSRLLPADETPVTRRRTWSRAAIGRLFAASVRCLLAPPVKDTQCGFKMFRAAAGKTLFARATETGYLFDIEILVMAERLGYRIEEVPINWADQPGGQLVLRSQWRRIIADLWRVRRRLRRFTTREGALPGAQGGDGPA